MERITEHLERLLLQHDCVIVPEFGGFVLQSMPVVYMCEDNSFTPSRKEIVFNPTLRHNDGLLIQSYMEAYSVDYNYAQQLVKKDVAEIRQYLDDNGECSIASIGVFYMEDNRLVFMPDENSCLLFSVTSYGLPVFHFLPLSALKQSENSALVLEKSNNKAHTVKQKKNALFNIPITKTFVGTVLAAAVGLILFLLISPPVGDVNKASYTASFVPQDMMPKSAKHTVSTTETNQPSIDSTPVDDTGLSVTEESADKENITKEEDEAGKLAEAKPEVKPAEVNTEVKPEEKRDNKAKAKPEAKPEKKAEVKYNYYVVIGSFNTRAQANAYLKRLKTDAAKTAKILVSDGHVRVYAQGFQTESEAEKYLRKIRQNPQHKQAWLYKRK